MATDESTRRAGGIGGFPTLSEALLGHRLCSRYTHPRRQKEGKDDLEAISDLSD